MKNKQFFILILLLVIGFASISATLVINGNTKVAANLDGFNVIFIEGFLNGETNEDVIISGDKKTLTFTTNKLTNINDTARIDYKVKNISTQYDGDVTINCTNESNEYVNVTSSFDSKTLPLTTSINMQAQEVKSGYINAELTKPTTEDQEVKVTCKIEVSATSRTNYAYSLVFDSDGGSVIDDKSVNLNESYGELSVPEKEGYTFIGWFNEEDVMVDETTILDTKGNKTLTAKWASIAYPVEMKKVYKDKTETSMINIPYGESVDALITIDDKYFIDNIKCTNGYTIDDFNKPVYESENIKINNNNNSKAGTCTLTMLQGIYDFDYTGSEQLFKVPYAGNYKIELWGASGGISKQPGGLGAYVSGKVTLNFDKNIYLYIGEKGADGSRQTNFTPNASYNGGGRGQNTTYPLPYEGSPYVSGSGGGATDVRLENGNWNDFSSMKSIIMIAGAGGSCGHMSLGGAAGGLIAETTQNSTGENGGLLGATGGTQTSGGLTPRATTSGSTDFIIGNNGFFHRGGSATSNTHPGGAGGAGYYGGAAGGAGGMVVGGSGGAGGSSFISGHNGCDAIAESSTQTNIIHTGQPNHYSGYVFTDTIMVDGAGYKWTNVKGEQTGMPTHDGKSTMTGNEGNGYAKITYLGK